MWRVIVCQENRCAGQELRRHHLIGACAGLMALVGFGFAGFAAAQDPPPSASNEVGRPLSLPPKTRPIPKDQSLSYWVSQLSHDQFFRRRIASKKLAEAGPAAIPAIVDAMKSGDLETVERAVWVMSEIALTQPPDDDGGAWSELNKLATRASGIRASRARAALEEIREDRAHQARLALTAAGVFVGIDQFIVRALSQPQMMVQFDERWQGDVKVLQWLRWLDGIEFARLKGAAVRPAVFARLIEIPDLRTIAIIDATVDRATLEPLLRMSRIDALEFRYVKLTPELGDMVAAMPLRVSLNLMGTGIASEQVAAMRAALPGLAIDHKRGGFLGVKCDARLDICRISSTVPGGAAEAAGLIPGDVIVRVGESEILKFSDLQDAINQYLPGDEIEVHFTRGQQLDRVTLRLRRLTNP